MFVQAVAAAFAVLTGLMAFFSGLYGTGPYFQGRHLSELQDALNEGVMVGFLFGVPAALVAYMLVLSS